MSRGTHADLTTEFRSEWMRPVVLLWIETGESSVSRITDYDGSIVWGGYTWSPRPFEIGTVALDGTTASPELPVSIADTDLWYKAIVDGGGDLEGRRVRIYRTDLTIIEAGDVITKSIRDDFAIESVDQADGIVRLNLSSWLTWLREPGPRGLITRTDFPGIPNRNQV